MRPSLHAFTRLELLACVAAAALVAGIALPALAGSRAEGDRAACANNLRLFGRAVNIWGADHGELPPWLTYVSNGGNRPDGGGGRFTSAWQEYTALSNELATPRILACPADDGVKAAVEFSAVANRGYMATGMRALATSYWLNTDNLFSTPQMALVGDRNVRTLGSTQCGYGYLSVDYRSVNGGDPVFWTNAVHGVQGHVAQTDGSVAFTTSAALLNNWGALLDDNGSFHHLRAR